MEYTYQIAMHLAQSHYGSFRKIKYSDSLTTIPNPSNPGQNTKVNYPLGYGLTSSECFVACIYGCIFGEES